MISCKHRMTHKPRADIEALQSGRQAGGQAGKTKFIYNKIRRFNNTIYYGRLSTNSCIGDDECLNVRTRALATGSNIEMMHDRELYRLNRNAHKMFSSILFHI